MKESCEKIPEGAEVQFVASLTFVNCNLLRVAAMPPWTEVLAPRQSPIPVEERAKLQRKTASLKRLLGVELRAISPTAHLWPKQGDTQQDRRVLAATLWRWGSTEEIRGKVIL